MNLNRAVHEDVVAVEILPKGQWTCPSSVVTTTSTENKDDDDDDDDNSNDDDDLKVMCILYFMFRKFPRFGAPKKTVRQHLQATNSFVTFTFAIPA